MSARCGRVPALALVLIVPTLTEAQPAPLQTSRAEQPALGALPEAVVEARSATWPLMLDVHALIGVEPTDRGSPAAFGAGMELLWRARLGGFAEVLASEGTAVVAPTVNGVRAPSLADRVSVPFGLAARPFARRYAERGSFVARLISGFGVQLGVSVEHLRTNDDEKTTAGLHAALGLDVPIYGGPKRGGVAVRLGARLLIAPEVKLDNNTVYEPNATGQLFAGLSYYP